MTLRLLLVRHGLSSFNLERRIQGRNDLSTLTEDGKQQAIKIGKALTKLKFTLESQGIDDALVFL